MLNSVELFLEKKWARFLSFVLRSVSCQRARAVAVALVYIPPLFQKSENINDVQF